MWQHEADVADGQAEYGQPLHAYEAADPNPAAEETPEGEIEYYAHDFIENEVENTRTLPLEHIAYSQDSVARNVNTPDGPSSVEGEITALTARAGEIGAVEAAREFQARLGTISISLVMGPTPDQSQYYTMDNRRLTIMRRALPGNTLITANIATRTTRLSMVGINTKEKEKQLKKHYGKGSLPEDLTVRTKYTNGDNGRTIRIRNAGSRR